MKKGMESSLVPNKFYIELEEKLRNDEGDSEAQEALGSDDPIVRIIGLNYLSWHENRSGEEERIRQATPLLDDTDWRVRQGAYRALFKLVDKESGNQVLRLAEKSLEDPVAEVTNSTLKLVCFQAKEVVKGAPKEWMTLANQALQHPEDEVRAHAVGLLGLNIEHCEDPVSEVKRLLADESKEVREEATSLLFPLLKYISAEHLFEEFMEYPLEEYPEVWIALAAAPLTYKELAQVEQVDALLREMIQAKDINVADWAGYVLKKRRVRSLYDFVEAEGYVGIIARGHVNEFIEVYEFYERLRLSEE